MLSKSIKMKTANNGKTQDAEQLLQPDSPIVTVCAVASLPGTNRANHGSQVKQMYVDCFNKGKNNFKEDKKAKKSM